MTIKRWLIALVLLLLAVVPSLAQDAANPLILVKDGDLWDWTGGPALRQKTQWGYNSGLSVSPQLNEVAYGSLATIVVDYIKQNGGVGGGGLPNNLWVIALSASDEAYRVADQPADAAFLTNGEMSNMLMRSAPMWSPDGTQIAWAETGYAQDATYRLMIYDKASQTTRIVLEDIPAQFGAGAGLNGVWRYEGIVLYSYTPSSTNPAGGDWSLIVIDPASGLVQGIVSLPAIANGDETLEPRLEIPVTYRDHRAIGVLYMGMRTSQWYIVDLEGTLTPEAVSSVPVGMAPQEGTDDLIHVSPRVLFSEATGPAISYEFSQPDGTPIILTDDPQHYAYKFALSPDGLAIAYQLASLTTYEFGNTVYVWRDGQITIVPETEGLSGVYEFAWGDTWWKMPE